MAIKTGDKIPAVTLKKLGDNGMEEIDIASYVAGRKVIIFAVPGAFTPPCSQKHLPSYIENAAEFKAKGIDEIICIAVNDPFVMKQWSKVAGAEGRITMMPDGNAEFTKAIGMEMDGSAAGLGTRSWRYSMIVEDGTVTSLQTEDNPGEVTVSGGETCLAQLDEKSQNQ